MKIILDNKFNIVDVEDTLEELLVKGSNRFDKLAVFIPTTLKEQYASIYPTYAVKRADGRELGNYTMPTNDSSVQDYYGWSAPFNARDLAVEGALQITITFTLNNTVKKTVCNVTTNVRKALQVDDDVYIIGDGDNVVSVMESILTAVGNLRGYSFTDIGNASSGTLTDAQIEQITGYDFFVIKNGNQYFTPTIKNTLIAICYSYEFASNSNGYYTLTAHKLDIDLTAKTFVVTTEQKNTYTKEKVDELLLLKEALSNKTSVWHAQPNDIYYPTEKLVKDTVDDLSGTVDDLQNQVTGVDTRVGSIENKIPAQASANNQLADKAFVNSSIATATATYQGNLNLITDLNLTLADKDNYNDVEDAIENYFHILTLVNINENDYCYVSVPINTTTTTTYQRVDRYKYDGSYWHYEYTLNNSGFTARQWAAINSGVTLEKIADMTEDIHDNSVDISYLQTDLSALETRVGTAEEEIDSVIEDVSVQSGEINDNYNRTNNALYHLGAYDTVSGNTITRQTGYAIFDGSDDEDWESWDADQYRIVVPNLIQQGDSIGLVCSNRYKESSNWSYQQRIGIFNAGGNVVYQIFIRDNNYTLSTFKESLRTNPLIVQYKLATAYTESVIEDRPLNTLDQQGCNWLRGEWEKGLNLIDYSKAIQNYGINSSNGNVVSASGYYYIDNVQLKPNTTFTLAQDSSIYEYSSNMTYLGRKTGTFTTSSNATFFRFECQTSITTTPMLNESSHAYPYQPYNGAIVREKDLDNFEFTLDNYGNPVLATDVKTWIANHPNFVNTPTKTKLKAKVPANVLEGSNAYSFLDLIWTQQYSSGGNFTGTKYQFYFANTQFHLILMQDSASSYHTIEFGNNNFATLSDLPTTAQMTAWSNKQTALVSGTNIKTINGASILGSGDLVISSAGSKYRHVITVNFVERINNKYNTILFSLYSSNQSSYSISSVSDLISIISDKGEAIECKLYSTGTIMDITNCVLDLYEDTDEGNTYLELRGISLSGTLKTYLADSITKLSEEIDAI